MEHNNIIVIGEGSYGKILFDAAYPNIVSKLHYLSSLEQETGCDELFKHEYTFHNILWQQLVAKPLSIPRFIIPKPINYKRITQQADACIYNMEKLAYPNIQSLQSLIEPDILDKYVKTNPVAHSPPYLLFSATSEHYEHGKVKLTNMQGIDYYQELYYVFSNPVAESLAKTMMTHFFEITFESKIVLQDVEFLLTETDNQLCVGMIDFNQVIDFSTRVTMASRRIPNYSIETDIANTYLFLSGIDTGSLLTDRNTQWKFMPTPHILPHTFFTTMQQIQHNTNNIIEHICETIYSNELNSLPSINIDIIQNIMVWHEILVYGAYDTELFDKLHNQMTYIPYDKNVINTKISNYTYFSNNEYDYGLDNNVYDEYYILSSINDQTYLNRMQQKQKNGIISQNMIHPIIYYDIMFQRLFIIKKLIAVGTQNINNKRFIKLLKSNASFETIVKYIHKSKPKQKTQRYKPSRHRQTKKIMSISSS
jgi:hypothetical protein